MFEPKKYQLIVNESKNKGMSRSYLMKGISGFFDRKRTENAVDIFQKETSQTDNFLEDQSQSDYQTVDKQKYHTLAKECLDCNLSDDEVLSNRSTDRSTSRVFDMNEFRVYRSISFGLNLKKNEIFRPKLMSFKRKAKPARVSNRKAFFMIRKPTIFDSLKVTGEANMSLFFRLIYHFTANIIYTNSEDLFYIEKFSLTIMKITLLISFTYYCFFNYYLMRIFIFILQFNLCMRAFFHSENINILQLALKQSYLIAIYFMLDYYFIKDRVETKASNLILLCFFVLTTMSERFINFFLRKVFLLLSKLRILD